MSKAARNLWVVRRAGKLFDFPRVLKSRFNAYTLSRLEYCAPVRMSSAGFHLSLPDSIVRSAERLHDGKLHCLGNRKTVSAFCLLYEIYHRANPPVNEYLHHFVAARNLRASPALCELALGIPRCRTDQFCRSFLPATVRLWSLLPCGCF